MVTREADFGSISIYAIQTGRAIYAEKSIEPNKNFNDYFIINMPTIPPGWTRQKKLKTICQNVSMKCLAKNTT